MCAVRPVLHHGVSYEGGEVSHELARFGQRDLRRISAYYPVQERRISL